MQNGSSELDERLGRGARRNSRRLRALATAAALLVAVFALGGCIAIKTQTTSQRVPGVITLNAVVCASDSDREFYADCDTAAPGRNTAEETNSDDANADVLGQVLAGFRVPAGTIAPGDFASDTQDVFFSASPTYTTQLDSRFPPPAGQRWVGYISTPKNFELEDLNDPAGRQTAFAPEFTLPSQADGAPFAGPFPWRLVVGIRALTSQDQAGNPVSCGAGTACFDSPATARIPTNVTAAVSDFGVVAGTTTVAGHGEAATVPFPIQYQDARGKGAQDLAITATTTLPGSTATPSVTTLRMDPNSAATVNVTVPVPPATPLGSYVVTLSAATGSPAVTRWNTATIQVTDKLAPDIRISTPADGARFVRGRTIAADYACSDETNGSGLTACSGPVPPGAAIDTGSLGAKTFSVAARDSAGNTTTATRSYRVIPRPAPAIKLAFNFAAGRSSTTFTKLVVKGVPKGSKVAAKCRPKRKGERCPAKAFTKRKASGKVKLKPFVGKRLRPGTVIDVRVTKSGSIGAVKLVKIRSNSAPTIATRCLRPGAKKPRKSC